MVLFQIVIVVTTRSSDILQLLHISYTASLSSLPPSLSWTSVPFTYIDYSPKTDRNAFDSPLGDIVLSWRLTIELHDKVVLVETTIVAIFSEQRIFDKSRYLYKNAITFYPRS